MFWGMYTRLVIPLQQRPLREGKSLYAGRVPLRAKMLFEIPIHVRAPEELLDDAHLYDRGFWKQVEHPELGRSFVYPGEATIYNGSPWRISCLIGWDAAMGVLVRRGELRPAGHGRVVRACGKSYGPGMDVGRER